jgi:hypothetical protein
MSPPGTETTLPGFVDKQAFKEWEPGVMSKCSDFWRQAQVCMSLARACNHPVLKGRYEELALDFAQRYFTPVRG